jgi:anti-sigma regulatory factor (Ser/Thr protein kinase)
MAEPQAVCPIQDLTHIAVARRHAVKRASALGFDDSETSNLAIAVTEAATNLLKHAGSGELIFRNLSAPETGIEVLSIDQGPGLSSVSGSMLDGYSTKGTPGNGLGAMKRLSQEFDLYSDSPNPGLVLRMAFWPKTASKTPPSFDVGAVCLPMAGETACGDDWICLQGPDTAIAVVADGLGHGPEAAIASHTATSRVDAAKRGRPGMMMELLHGALRSTRGAAVAIADIDSAKQDIAFVGIGNIGACVVHATARQQLISHNGIVGHSLRRVQEFHEAWVSDPTLIMHSDGLLTRWEIDRYPGLLARHPGVIAGVMYRDYTRGRDDITVLVVRRRPLYRS